MLSYTDLIVFFGTPLFDEKFQAFLKRYFPDLTDYNILESEYISSETCGVDLGFKNDDAIYDEDDNVLTQEGLPVFSWLNLYPRSKDFLTRLPFNISFSDTREIVLEKAGFPAKTFNNYVEYFQRNYLIDHYQLDNAGMSIDYNASNYCIDFIQLRQK